MEPNVALALEAFAQSQPSAPAIHAPGRASLTFAHLAEQVREARTQLRSFGIGPGDVIPAVIPTRPEMAVACAVTPASGVFVPLSPTLTVEAYAELLTRLRPKAVMVPGDRSHAIHAAAIRCRVAEVHLDGNPSRPAGMFSLELARPDESLHRSPTVGADIAYVSSTSGTTGRPKLIPISHRRSILFSKVLTDWLSVTPADIGCHIVPFHQGHGLNSAFMGPLLRGSSVICLPEGGVDAFYEALDVYRPTWLTAVFTMHKAILRSADEHRDVVARSRLRFLKVGSGALDSREIDELERLFRAPVLSALTALEGALITHEPLPPRARKHGSVGLPVCNEVVTRRDDGSLCNPGEIGEVVVRGPLVFGGYLDDPETSAATLVDGWCHTGDLGRFDEDGYLFLEGRIKDLINRGGEKFAPQRIDRVIEELPGVEAAGAFGVPHPTLGEEVAAAVVRAPGATIDQAQVIEHARQRLGAKGSPRAVYFVSELPLTDTGKIRRSELVRLLGLDRRAAADTPEPGPFSHSLSPIETALSSLWSSVLGTKNVGVDDDFFLLGGDSLSGARLIAAVKAVCGAALTLEQLLGSASTVAGMARAVETARGVRDKRGRQSSDVGARISRRYQREAIPLSDTQRRMWFLACLDPESIAYNESRAYRISGEIDAGVLDRSVRHIVSRHEILRTTYRLVDGDPRQFVHDESPVGLETFDLSATLPEQRAEALNGVLLSVASKPFNHETGPLLRCALVRLSARQHVFLRVWHHIVSDGWSSGIFNRELSAAYAAFAGGREPALPPLPIQYADYVEWRREQLQGDVLARQLDYWKRQLADVTTLELPTDRSRPAIQSHRGGHYFSELPASMASALKELSRDQGVTLFMTLLAAYQVLLHRYSGQDDIAVGTPIAGRRHLDLEGLLGFFANTLVLRSNLSGNPSFRSLLARVRDVALGAYQHQDLPFEKLVEELAPTRDPSRNPLYQASFTLRNLPGGSFVIPGAEVAQVPLEIEASKFDLSLAIGEESHGLSLEWTYASDLFDASTITSMAEHFKVLLSAIVSDPDQPIRRLPLLTEAERYDVLHARHETRAGFPIDRCAHQLFEAQVTRTPDTVAIVFEGQYLTYAELNARANQLARRLMAAGVGPGSLAGLCAGRSLEMVIGLLAILKAGGAYVPLDPSWPAARLQMVTDDARLTAVVAPRALADLWSPATLPLVVIDGVPSEVVAHEGDGNPDVPLSPANLVYVLYTSGTTGRPKGVRIEHRQLVQYVWAVAERLDLDSRGSYAMVQPLAFDSCQTMIFPALARGGTLHLVSDARALDASELGEYIRSHRIDYLKITPSHMTALLDQAPSSSLLPQRALILGGEASHWNFIERLWSLSPRCAIWNHYGPTETTVGVCASRVVSTGVRKALTAPIGRPFTNVRFYVLDSHLEPVPRGVPGELWIGGAQVSPGYLNRDELTAERFVSDPFNEEPNARMYRTGDLVRCLADGQMEFLGRTDHQVKIRGFRIELGEIEVTLRAIDGVRDAVVVVGDSVTGGERLVAFVVLDEHAVFDDRTIRADLGALLPTYMVPSQFVRLEQLPRTAHGKIDRKALVVPDVDVPVFEPPVGSAETTIAKIWAEVLKLERVGRRDHFFEIGGHSLLAVTVLARMRQAGLLADVRALFVTPTLADLARSIVAGADVVDVPPNRIPAGCTAITPDMLPLVQLTVEDISRITRTVEGGAGNVQDIYPLAPLQEGILFHHQLSTQGDPYSMFAMFAFDSHDRVQRYVQALQAVVDRHDIFRTAVVWEGLAEPVQVVWRHAPIVVEELDLAESDDVVEELQSRFDPRRFRLDLRRAPAIRVLVARDPRNSRWVMLRISHHVLWDHISSEIVRREVEAHLSGRADGLAPPVPFRIFVARARLSATTAAHEKFFREMLGDVDEPTTPFGLADVHSSTTEIAAADLQIDGALATRLREQARAIGVSAAVVCHVAWAQVLGRVSGRTDVVFGTVLFGRMLGGAGVDLVPGLFINTLPIRVRFDGSGARDGVREMHRRLAELLTHEHAPLALAQRCSAVPAPAPLFSALLNYRHRSTLAEPASQAALEGIVPLSTRMSRTNYPLKMAVTDQGEGFLLSAQAQRPIDPKRICQLLQTALEALIAALEHKPDTPLHLIDVLPASERALLPDLSQPIDAPAQIPVVTQVLEWTRVAPERTAVRMSGSDWTYAELRRRASALAAQLNRVGVGRGDVVAVVAPRSTGLVGAMLGVMMSGGVLLTIDPTLPAKRKQVMLAEARAKAICAIGPSIDAEDYLEPGHTRVVVRADLDLTLEQDWQGAPMDAWSAPEIHGDDPAYVFFTSGSTGQPKAILGVHKSLSHFLQWQRRTFRIDADDRVSQLIGLTFDPLLRDVFLPLTAGAAVCVPSDKDVVDTLAWLERESVSAVHTTPVAMQSWLIDEKRRIDLPALRWVFVSGEPLTDALITRWRRIVAGPAQLVNFYGPTETTMIRCYHIVPDEMEAGVQPLGVPIDHSQALVLNPAGMVCGRGETGEIVLRTPFRSLGYLNLPEETARRFRRNPFRDDPDDLLYFTGDRGRHRPDGLLEIAGRIDDQVKIRGVRIDPGEVTATLARHEAVRQCFVVGRDDGRGQSQLVGYVALEPGRQAAVRDLRTFLSDQLPHAFVPSSFVFLDSLPVLPNGKVDRQALLAMHLTDEPDGAAEGPRGEVEELIADIWSEVLRIERPGVHDNFFALGGHSLSAAQVVARLSSALGVTVPLRCMFDEPTIADMAAFLCDEPGE